MCLLFVVRLLFVCRITDPICTRPVGGMGPGPGKDLLITDSKSEVFPLESGCGLSDTGLAEVRPALRVVLVH